MSFTETEILEISRELKTRLHRAKVNLDLLIDNVTTKRHLTAIPFDVLDDVTEQLYSVQAAVHTLGPRFEDMRTRRHTLEARFYTPSKGDYNPRRPRRVVPNPVDEMMDGSVNETLPANHPYFQEHPLIYVHGGPSTCIICKETHPCGCRPPTPAERPAFQSPIPAS